MRKDKVTTHKGLCNSKNFAPKTEYTPFQERNYQHSKPEVHIFKTNVKFLITYTGHGAKGFFKKLNSLGLMTDRCNFLYKDLRFFPSLLYVGTFSRLFSITTSQILSADLIEQVKKGYINPVCVINSEVEIDQK
jgi:hypothetical protein